jgi:hypothetical protein
MSKPKKAPVNRAVATIKQPMGTDAAKVSVTSSVSQAMAKSPDWVAATVVQSAVSAWTSDATALDANTKLIANLRAQLAVAESKQGELRRNWAASKMQVMSAVTVFCGGSADRVKAFNLDVVTRYKLGPLATPSNLAVNPGAQPGLGVAQWAKGPARHGFLVQHTTDPSNPATISAPMASTKTRFSLDGLTSGATVSMRVAAIDPASPTGQTSWSAWVVGNAR